MALAAAYVLAGNMGQAEAVAALVRQDTSGFNPGVHDRQSSKNLTSGSLWTCQIAADDRNGFKNQRQL